MVEKWQHQGLQNQGLVLNWGYFKKKGQNDKQVKIEISISLDLF